MDEYNYLKKSQVPAFGSWDYNDDDLPFTQCFETAAATKAAAGFLRYSYSDQDRDLYVAGDLYDNEVVTPAVIVVPRKRGKARYPKVKEEKKESKWVVYGDYAYDYGAYDVKDPPTPVSLSPSPPSPPPPPKARAKAVDEDLYKISPDLLRAQHNKKKKAWGFFSSCLRPMCAH